MNFPTNDTVLQLIGVVAILVVAAISEFGPLIVRCWPFKQLIEHDERNRAFEEIRERGKR